MGLSGSLPSPMKRAVSAERAVTGWRKRNVEPSHASGSSAFETGPFDWCPPAAYPRPGERRAERTQAADSGPISPSAGREEEITGPVRQRRADDETVRVGFGGDGACAPPMTEVLKRLFIPCPSRPARKKLHELLHGKLLCIRHSPTCTGTTSVISPPRRFLSDMAASASASRRVWDS
jgi:hypothetical protein